MQKHPALVFSKQGILFSSKSTKKKDEIDGCIIIIQKPQKTYKHWVSD